MQSPTYLLSHRIVRNNSTVDSSFPAPQHLRLLPVLGNSLIPWVLGSSRDLFPSTEAKRKQVCVCFHLIPWQPWLQSGCLHLELYIWSKWYKDRRMARDDHRHRIWCLAAASATSLWRPQHQPQVVTRRSLGQSRGWLLSCPVYLGSCPFSTPGSLAFLLTLWTTQYPFSNFLFLSLQELVPIYL